MPRGTKVFHIRHEILLAGIGAVSSGAAMATTTTFAQYLQTNGSQQDWIISTSGNTTIVSATGSVLFLFSGVTGLPFSAPELANFTLTATTTQPGSCSISCGTGGSFNASATTGNLSQLVSSSSYISFLGATNETSAFSLSSLIPNFATGAVTGNQAYPAGTDHAAGSGTFSSDPAPVATAVPEPASLALPGAGALGLVLSRKRRA